MLLNGGVFQASTSANSLYGAIVLQRLSHLKTGGIKPSPLVITVSRQQNLGWQRKLAAERESASKMVGVEGRGR